MGLSLRDQLIQAGFAQPKPEPPPARSERGPSGKPPDRNARSRANDRNSGRRPEQRPDDRNSSARPDQRPNDRNSGGRPEQRPNDRNNGRRPEQRPTGGAAPEKSVLTSADPAPPGVDSVKPKGDPGRPRQLQPPRDPNREPSLAAAYNARAETEKREREQAQKRAQEEAQRKREQRIKLTALVAGKGVNVPLSEHTRNFMYGKKIRKVNVTAEQFLQLNAGELGVVQVDGRFLILPAAIVVEALAIGRQYIALYVPEGIGASGNAEDDYSDPRFKVPDDLVW